MEYDIKITAFESGMLMGTFCRYGLEDKMPKLWEQLVQLKKYIEEQDGVTKVFHEDGTVTVTDRDGTIIIRERFPWEEG